MPGPRGTGGHQCSTCKQSPSYHRVNRTQWEHAHENGENGQPKQMKPHGFVYQGGR